MRSDRVAMVRGMIPCGDGRTSFVRFSVPMQFEIHRGGDRTAPVRDCGMPKEIKVGQIVVADGLVGVYRVVGVSPDAHTADIEKFDVSKQRSLGDPIRTVAMNKLSPYKEDARQTSARIVREATTED